MCPACKEELEKKFEQVKEHIRGNKNATIQTVAEECDVAESQIKQWVREERLIFSEARTAGIVCENCGESITTGRYCDKCKAQMINGLGGISRREPIKQIEEPKKDSPKMRFLDGKRNA